MATTSESFVRTHTPGLLRLAFLLADDPVEAQAWTYDVLAPEVENSGSATGRAEYTDLVRRLVERRLTSQPASWLAPPAAEPESLTFGLGPGGKADVDLVDAMLVALRELSPRQRTVLVLRYQEGFDEQGAGELLMLPAVAITGLVGQALTTLRQRAEFRDLDGASSTIGSISGLVAAALERQALNAPDPSAVVRRLLHEPIPHALRRALAITMAAAVAGLAAITVITWPHSGDGLASRGTNWRGRTSEGCREATRTVSTGQVHVDLTSCWQLDCRYVVLGRGSSAPVACSEHFDGAPRSEVLVGRGRATVPKETEAMDFDDVRQEQLMLAGQPVTLTTGRGFVRYGCEVECRRGRPRYISVLNFPLQGAHVQILGSSPRELEAITSDVVISIDTARAPGGHDAEATEN